MKLVTCLAAAAATPLLFALVSTEEKVAFSVAEGLSLEKSFAMSSAMSMDNFNMLMNGNPPPFPMEMEMTVEASQTVEVTDEYLAVGDGRPTKLKRTYSTLDLGGKSEMENPMTGPMSADTSGGSELEGYAVLFDWDAQASEYDVRYADEKQGDSALLDGLEEDMDLRALLPNRPLAIGDTYEIPPTGLVGVLAPGGNLQLKPDDAEAQQMGMGSDQNLADMLGELTGSATGELLAVREEDGRRIAVIRLKIDIESARDMTEAMQTMMANNEDVPGGMDVQSADVEITMQLEGELTWDLAGGHFVSLELKGDFSSTVDVAMSMDPGNGPMNIEQTIGMSGTQSYVFATTRL